MHALRKAIAREKIGMSRFVGKSWSTSMEMVCKRAIEEYDSKYEETPQATSASTTTRITPALRSCQDVPPTEPYRNMPRLDRRLKLSNSYTMDLSEIFFRLTETTQPAQKSVPSCR